MLPQALRPFLLDETSYASAFDILGARHASGFMTPTLLETSWSHCDTSKPSLWKPFKFEMGRVLSAQSNTALLLDAGNAQPSPSWNE